MMVRMVCSAVKTGKAVWCVSLICVWRQPSWLPALLTSLASASWLPCPHFTLLTHTNSYTCELCTLIEKNTVEGNGFGHVVLPLSHVDALVHRLRQGDCFLSTARQLYTSCLSFPSEFFLRAPQSFHHRGIWKVDDHLVLVCLSWIGA